MKKICSIIATAVVLFFATIVIGAIIYTHLWHAVKFKPATIVSVEYRFAELPTRPEIKKRVDLLFGNPRYKYAEGEIEAGGLTNLFKRKITIAENLRIEAYAFVLAHELTHLTTYTYNERYCQVNAFKVLYESEDDFLRNSALFALSVDLQGGFTHEYAFAGNVEQYLLHV